MRSRRTIDVSFTELLYAVVAGSVVQHFDPYKWSWDNTIVLAGVFVLVDDWVLYHAEAPHIQNTARNSSLLLFVDVVLLLLWYAAARAGSLGSAGLFWFVTLLGGFYFGAGLAEYLFEDYRERATIAFTNLICSGVLWSWAGLLSVTRFHPDYWIVLIVLLTLAFVRARAWRRLLPRRTE